MSETIAQDQRSNAGGRAAKAREELAAVPSQDLPGDLAVADDLDADADLDGADLEGDLEDFEDLGDEDLSDVALGAEDLEITDTPDGDLIGADADDHEGDEPEPAAAGMGAEAAGGAAGGCGMSFVHAASTAFVISAASASPPAGAPKLALSSARSMKFDMTRPLSRRSRRTLRAKSKGLLVW